MVCSVAVEGKLSWIELLGYKPFQILKNVVLSKFFSMLLLQRGFLIRSFVKMNLFMIGYFIGLPHLAMRE